MNDEATNLEDGVTVASGGQDYLGLTRQALEHSDSFLTAHKRKEWERALDHFAGKHPAGSKYNSSDYKGRTKLFRPKTRATVRKDEAAAAAAFFSTLDVVNIAPADDSDDMQRASAEVMNEVVNFRLTKTIPWFLILLGAKQTADVVGVCCSKQRWEYEVEVGEPELTPEVDPLTGGPMIGEDGVPVFREERQRKVIKDRPRIDLIAPENLRVHEGSDWLDPIGSSPFVIEKIAMMAGEVRRRSEVVDPKTNQPEWLPIENPSLGMARVDEDSGIRERRSGYDPIDPAGATSTIEDHEMVWVHECIFRIEGKDWHWFALGDGVALLTDPRPLEEVYKHGRPYVFGYGTLEAFTIYPRSKVDLLSDLQTAVNDVQNTRMDNVKFALSPRTRVAAGEKVDMKTLTNGPPGSAVIMQKVDNVQYDRPPEVTGSAYAEQDRLNVDFDELAGSFSTGSVMTNRQMNETVGGMAMLTNNANALTEYDLRVFSETWVEPVLRQLVKLEQSYETDLHVLALAGRKAQSVQKFGMDPVLDDLLSAELTVSVNVGIGNLDPSTRLQKFMIAAQSTLQLATGIAQMFGPQALKSPGFEAMTKEIFGSAGYKDGQRFLDFGEGPGGPDPQMQQAMQVIQQMQQEIAQLQQQLQSKQADAQSRLAMEGMRQEGAMRRDAMNNAAQMERETFKAQADILRTRSDTLAERQNPTALPPRGM